MGAEMLHEVLLPAWHSSEAENNFFIGPNVSYRGNRWFATVTALAQTTRTEGEADYQVRLIFESACERPPPVAAVAGRGSFPPNLPPGR